jgi:hypothetical protein
MTDEQINTVITELIDADPHWKCAKDYCTDLNAMHEAEEQMDEIDWVFFMTELANLVRLPKQAEVQIKRLVHSTARQRAEAFLRALGKWEEGK